MKLASAAFAAAVRSIRAELARLTSNDSGAVAIIFALSLIVTVTIVGGALDYGRWFNAKSRMQSAIDNAALAAGRVAQTSGGDVTEVIATARTYYNQMKSQDVVTEVANFGLAESGKAVIATSDATVSTPFLAVAGFSTLPIHVAAKVQLAGNAESDNRVEVSMMLDITGSMGGQKIADLKLAAKDLVNIVVDSNNPEYARVAVAPFSEQVNVGVSLYRSVTGQYPEVSNTRYTCVRERQTSDRYTDAKPQVGNYFTEGPQNGSCKPTSTIKPLSGDKDSLNSHIDTLGADGLTAGHLGTAWAWYMLSPKWNTIWGGGIQAGDYGDPKLKKIAVLMTDGEYNRQYSGSSSTTQARAICANMKAAGLTVYSVVFQLVAGSEAETTMRQCATSSAHFFNAQSGEELRQTFREIALQITTLRLSK